MDSRSEGQSFVPPKKVRATKVKTKPLVKAKKKAVQVEAVQVEAVQLEEELEGKSTPPPY